MTLKALVCDDEAPARSELRFMLSEAGDVEVVGEASSAGEALQLALVVLTLGIEREETKQRCHGR